VVEDSPTHALQLRHVLEKSGYAVTVASGGEEGLAWLRDHQPALVISDITPMVPSSTIRA
jgi:CheY-like chemotaxis protein